MSKDKRYNTLKNLISGGYIKTFGEIFDTIPKSVVAADLGMNNVRFTKLMHNPVGFLVNDLFRIAALIDIDEKAILDLVYNQHVQDKKSKRKK